MQELHPLTASQSPLWSSRNVHQVQRAKFPPARQRVLGEAYRPHLVGSRRQSQRHSRGACDPVVFRFLRTASPSSRYSRYTRL